MKANEFLEYAGTNYESLKKKWSTRLKKEGLSFSEDTYNDTIIKVYESLKKHEVEDNQIDGYWYKSFLTNTRRDGKYAYHKKDDSIDITCLANFPNEDRPILLEDIEERFKTLTEVETHIFLMYYLTKITFSQLEELTGIKNIRYQMKKIIKKIKGSH